MERIIAICLIVYAIGVVIYFVFEKRFINNTDLPPKKSKSVSGDDIIGKSLYNMSHKLPQAATIPEVDTPANKESIFVPETEKRFSVSIPNEELEEAFSESDNPEITEIYVPLEYEKNEDLKLEEETGVPEIKRLRNDFATGVSIEEMNEAVKIAKNEGVTDQERRQAGRTFYRIEGNSIYNQLMTDASQKRKAILEVMDFYLEGQKKKAAQINDSIPSVETEKYFDVSSVL